MNRTFNGQDYLKPMCEVIDVEIEQAVLGASTYSAEDVKEETGSWS